MSSLSSSFSFSSTVSSSNGGNEEDGKIRAMNNQGLQGIRNATTIVPNATTATPSVTATSATASTSSKYGTNVGNATIYDTSCSSISIASINHVPKSAAGWIVTQLVEYTQWMSTRNHTDATLASTFSQQAYILAPTGATTPESADRFINAIIDRFSRPTGICLDGLACLKCT